MPLPKQVREEAERIVREYCAGKVPDHAPHKVGIEFAIRGDSVTLIESRPHWQKPDIWIKMPVAQFRYDRGKGAWSLFCADRNSRWHDYQLGPKRDIRELLREVDNDPTGIFWG